MIQKVRKKVNLWRHLENLGNTTSLQANDHESVEKKKSRKVELQESRKVEKQKSRKVMKL